jgi:hypothetical protein
VVEVEVEVEVDGWERDNRQERRMAGKLLMVVKVKENEHDEPKISVRRNEEIRKRCGIDR